MKTVLLIVCLVLAPAGAMGLSIPSVIAVESPDPPPEQPDVEQEDRLSKDAMFMGGATIFALVAFGSLLNILFTSNKPRYGYLAIFILSFGIASGTLGSLFLMWTGCCVPVLDVALYYSVTFISLSGMIILLWVAYALNEMIERRKQAPSKDVEQAGGSPFP